MSGRQYGAIAVIAAGVMGVSASATPPAMRGANACLAHVPEAATRSGLPRDVITRVMMAESGGDEHAISPKGAMGCMQIMPTTWAMLTARYGLGSDPYDAHASMTAGSLYLAELALRYGSPGAYAAYNAGEARWLRYRDSGEPLPAETIAYMARIGGRVHAGPPASSQPRWQEANLFMARGADRPSSPSDSANVEQQPANDTPENGSRSGLPSIFPLARPALAERE